MLFSLSLAVRLELLQMAAKGMSGEQRVQRTHTGPTGRDQTDRRAVPRTTEGSRGGGGKGWEGVGDP